METNRYAEAKGDTFKTNVREIKAYIDNILTLNVYIKKIFNLENVKQFACLRK